MRRSRVCGRKKQFGRVKKIWPTLGCVWVQRFGSMYVPYLKNRYYFDHFQGAITIFTSKKRFDARQMQFSLLLSLSLSLSLSSNSGAPTNFHVCARKFSKPAKCIRCHIDF